MKYLKTYSTSAEYTSDKDDRQGRLWLVVSLTGGTTVNIDEDDILNKIPDGYEKCRYIYNTANLSANSTFMFSTASTVNRLCWVLKCSWQSDYFDNNQATVGNLYKYQLINNPQSRRGFGINMNTGFERLYTDSGLTVHGGGIAPSSNPDSPQLLKYINDKYTSGSLSGNFYIQLNVNDNVYETWGSEYGVGGTSVCFIGSSNYLFGSAYFPVWAYVRHVAIYEDNVLVHNLIPCKRKSDNQYGLYDTVDGTWHGHASLSGVSINTNDKGTATQFNPLEPIEGGDIRPL